MRQPRAFRLASRRPTRYNIPVSFLSSIFRRRRPPTLEELEERREHRSDGIRGVLGVSGLILLVLVSFMVSTLVLPPLLELDALKLEREAVERQLRNAEKDEEEAYHRYLWMQDAEYFENIARDRADQAKEGETVIRIPADRPEPPRDRPRGHEDR